MKSLKTPEVALLLPEKQPTGFRAGYADLSSLVSEFTSEAPASIGELPPAARRRLGYLVAAARMLAGQKVNPSWVSFEKTQLPLVSREPLEPLFRFDPTPTPSDGLAEAWGFSSGVRIPQLQQIVQYGTC